MSRRLLDNGVVAFLVACGAILLVGVLLAFCMSINERGPSVNCQDEPSACEP